MHIKQNKSLRSCIQICTIMFGITVIDLVSGADLAPAPRFAGLGYKADCTSTSLVNGLRKVDSQTISWLTQDNSTIKFDENDFQFTPMGPDVVDNWDKLKSIGNIQGLPDIYLTSISTPSKCQKLGCEMLVYIMTPFRQRRIATLWASQDSTVEFRHLSANPTSKAYNYAITLNSDNKRSEGTLGAAMPTQVEFLMRMQIFVGNQCDLTCRMEMDAGDVSSLDWQRPLTTMVRYSRIVKKSCEAN